MRVVLLLVLAVVGKQQGWIGTSNATKVATKKVTERSITESVAANGKIYPEIEVKISADVSGEIIDIFIEEGDSVQAGDMLVKIKPDIYESP